MKTVFSMRAMTELMRLRVKRNDSRSVGSEAPTKVNSGSFDSGSQTQRTSAQDDGKKKKQIPRGLKSARDDNNRDLCGTLRLRSETVTKSASHLWYCAKAPCLAGRCC